MYIITDIEGKGKGMLATREIQRGECIVTESPLLVYEEGDSPAALLRIVSAIKKKDQKSFYGLHRQASSSRSVEANIAQTNSLPLGRDATTRGVFRVISRINHSCAYNATHTWNSVTGKEVVVACKTIPEGSEVF